MHPQKFYAFFILSLDTAIVRSFSRWIFRRMIFTFINPHSFLALRRSGLLNRVFVQFNVGVDGVLLVLLARLCGVQVVRQSFDDTSLAPSVFLKAVSQGLSVGLVGSTTETIEQFSKRLREKYGLRIKYFRDGYFSSEEAPLVISRLAECDIVICGMGAPHQEALLMKLVDAGWCGDGYTCGGYFDQFVVSEGGPYYPRLVDRLHLRWAYRLYREPRRLWKRYLIDYPVGVCFFIFDMAWRRLWTDGESRVKTRIP